VNSVSSVAEMKNRKSKIANRKSSRRRRTLSVAAAKSLGYEFDSITAADAGSGLDVTLVGLFRYKKYENLKKAFERGQFLRNLAGLAGVVETVSEAARKLGLASGSALREILDTDLEAANLWNQRRLDTKIKAREGLITAAADGNQAAIRAIENYLRDDQRPASGGPDLHKLMQKDIADLFDVDRLTVRNWAERHNCPRNSDGSYDLASVIRWWRDFEKRRSGTHIEPADKLRDLKAEEKKLDLMERQHSLLDREEVISGLVARCQAMVGAFNYKRRELANMVHNQTIEGVEDILGRFFEDLQRQQLEVPEFLELPAAAAEKLKECFELLGGNL